MTLWERLASFREFLDECSDDTKSSFDAIVDEVKAMEEFENFNDELIKRKLP